MKTNDKSVDSLSESTEWGEDHSYIIRCTYSDLAQDRFTTETIDDVKYYSKVTSIFKVAVWPQRNIK